MSSLLDPYIDDEGRQIKPFPQKWIKPPAKAKIGAKVRYIKSDRPNVYVGPRHKGYSDPNLHKPEHWKSLFGQEGIILSVHPGRRGTGRWVPSHECYDTDSAGWLTVQFPFSIFRKSDGSFDAIALHFEEEGSVWEFV